MTTPQSDRPDVPEADRDWFGGRRWTGIGAIAFLILIILALVLVLVVHHSHTTTAAPTQQTSSVSSSLPSASADTAVPTTAPSGITWSVFATIALPSSATAGPARVSGSVATGYAHTPTGALVAAANEPLRLAGASDTEWRAATDAMVAPGAGKTAWEAIRVTVSSSAEPPGTLGQYAGFQFISYSSAEAALQLVMRLPDGTYQVGVEKVLWQDNDWKVELNSSGSAEDNVSTVSTLAGFIPWGGV